jgi:hypothetical protein
MLSTLCRSVHSWHARGKDCKAEVGGMHAAGSGCKAGPGGMQQGPGTEAEAGR